MEPPVTVGTSSAITTYTYDEQNRLTKTVTTSSDTDGTIDTLYYAYDNNGNMVSKSTETTMLVDLTGTGGFSVYKAGTTTESSITFYKHDVWNQLTEAVSGNKKEKYSYNGEGYRVAKNDNGQVTNYLYEYDKVILETDSSSNQLTRNVYGLNLMSRAALPSPPAF